MDEKTVCSELTEERKQEILVRLQERGVPQACPMCKGRSWTLLEGYFNHPLQTQIGKLVLGKSVPSVVIICNHCGYISQHALGPLGLLPPLKRRLPRVANSSPPSLFERLKDVPEE